MQERAKPPLPQRIARLVPAIRRLHDSRDQLLAERDAPRPPPPPSGHGASPFLHYHACFDAEAVLRRHAVPDLAPRAGYLVNFLGVAIDPKFFPAILDGMAGTVEAIPIPANWHADIAEWAAALRAVELASPSNRFTMIELGCGWGCWMNNTGVAARRRGLAVTLIGVEGDPGHIGFAREAAAANGFAAADVALYHGIASGRAGQALFPRQVQAGTAWGLEPIFHADPEQVEAAVASGAYAALPMLPLADVIGAHARIDLLHVDIQGGEADLVADCMNVLDERVAMLLIGTHSRQIEGALFERLQSAGWRLEIERPAILSLVGGTPETTVDGVQGWRNPALLP